MFIEKTQIFLNAFVNFNEYGIFLGMLYDFKRKLNILLGQHYSLNNVRYISIVW